MRFSYWNCYTIHILFLPFDSILFPNEVVCSDIKFLGNYKYFVGIYQQQGKRGRQRIMFEWWQSIVHRYMELFRECSSWEVEISSWRDQAREENKKKHSDNRGKQTKYIHLCFKCGYLQSSSLPHTSWFDALKPNALSSNQNATKRKAYIRIFMNIFASPNVNGYST